MKMEHSPEYVRKSVPFFIGSGNRNASSGVMLVLSLFAFIFIGDGLRAADAPAAKTVEFTIDFGEKALGKELYQLALWLETPDGKYLDTVYVTEKTGKKGLGNGYMKVLGLKIREAGEALPVWAHARGILDGNSLYPSAKNPLPDAVSSATLSVKQLKRTFKLTPAAMTRIGDGPVVCKAEINVSGDDFPSFVFKGVLNPADTSPVEMALAGSGHPKGKDGLVSPADARKRLDSVKLVKKATVCFAGSPK
ncbi:MAG TPA: hypothetical protein PL033_08805 [Candidatus Brocadiia bacterium]|nr:hypothetical protein [Candidatus Brocadiia bacterium]